MRTRSMPVLVAIILSALLFSAESYGQNDKVSVQFLAFPKSKDSEKLKLTVAGGRKISIELPSKRLSPVYTVDRVKDWVVGSSETDADGKSEFVVHGKTPVLDAKSQIVLILRNGLDGEDGLTLVAVDSGKEGLGGGKYFIMNTTEMKVGGELGDTDFSLEPGCHLLLAPEPSEVKGSRKYLFTKLYYIKEEEQKDFYSSTWRYSENARSIVLVCDNEEGGQLRIHTIRNYLR